jgi:poly(A) polymerase
MPSVSLSPSARRLLSKLRAVWSHHDADGYLTGGYLRDLLLDREARDIDIALVGDAPALARLAANAVGGACFALDEERGITRIVLPARAPVAYIDVTRLRGDIESDLAERDFTIDAMALPLETVGRREPQPLVDPFSGFDDVKDRTVRAVGDGVFRSDGLRLLRAARLCAELDFLLDADTAALVQRDAACIDGIAPERKRDELVRILATDRAAANLRLLDALGLLERLLPEVTACRGVTQPKEHYWDVFEHLLETVVALDFMLAESEPPLPREASLWRELWQQLEWLPWARAHLREETVEGRPRKALLKLAGLLHDIGKPETKAPDAVGRIRFIGHMALGAEKASNVMRRFRFSGAETHFVSTIIEQHLRPGQMSGSGPPTRRAIYHFFRDTGDAALDILFLMLADNLAARGPRLRFATWQGNVAFMNYILGRYYLEEEPVAPVRLVTGNDIMTELRIGPGPAVGKLLAAIEEAQALGTVSTRDEALALARRLLVAMPRQPQSENASC